MSLSSDTGVVASEDGADVATPVSLIEWFLDFYEETQSGRIKPRECIVQAGELLFVPRGWWHMALNLEVRDPRSSFKNRPGFIDA